MITFDDDRNGISAFHANDFPKIHSKNVQWAAVMWLRPNLMYA